ncbi:Uncharacterized protein TPAR_07555, partial [Tolypocladium paradoxum]
LPSDSLRNIFSKIFIFKSTFSTVSCLYLPNPSHTMTEVYELIENTLSGNNIPANADFLQWHVRMVHADGFTLGIISDEEGKFDTSKNHWAIIIETARRDVRLSMESRMNKKTRKHGVLVLTRLSYEGKSRSVLYRETYSWKYPAVTVKEVVEFALDHGWHKYKMFTTTDGAKKGCRHHLKTMLLGFQARGWIGSKSDDGQKIDDFLPFVYTRDEDDYNQVEVKPKSIDLGEFL